MLYSLVRPQGRATTAAICGILTNLVALGFGPVICGLIIDGLTAHELHRSGFGELAQTCIHGGAMTIKDIAQAAICANANITATRIALIGFTLAGIWPALHFLSAARAMRD